MVLAPGVGIRSSGMEDALKAEEEESTEAGIDVPEDLKDYRRASVLSINTGGRKFTLPPPSDCLLTHNTPPR